MLAANWLSAPPFHCLLKLAMHRPRVGVAQLPAGRGD